MAEQQQSKSKEDKTWYQRNSVAIWSTVIGIAALFSPMLLSMPAQFGIVFTNETGAAGDTFGGFANPFISILVAYLTYQAFMQQKRANEQQRGDLVNEIRERELAQKRINEQLDLQKRQLEMQELESSTRSKRDFVVELDNKFDYIWNLIDNTRLRDYIGSAAIYFHLKDHAGRPSDDMAIKLIFLGFIPFGPCSI